MKSNRRSPYVTLEYTWERLRPIVLSFAWVELYEGQRQYWPDLMSDVRNLVSRVRVEPGDGIIELYYDRYFGRTEFIVSNSTFVRIANFDQFYRELPGFETIKLPCDCDCFYCFHQCCP